MQNERHGDGSHASGSIRTVPVQTRAHLFFDHVISF